MKLALITITVLCLAVPAQARAAWVNTDPNVLHVLDNNVENFPAPAWPDSCDGDWSRLFAYLQNSTMPDIITFQQISNSQQLDYYVSLLKNLGAGEYGYRISAQIGEPTYGGNECSGYKTIQRNAILYRKDRLYPIGTGELQWTSKIPASTGACTKDDPDLRTRNIAERFQDRWSSRTVKVASIHWPSARAGAGSDGGNECASTNAAIALDYVSRGGATLQIVAGDVNKTDYDYSTSTAGDVYPWFNYMNTKFRDAARYGCRTWQSWMSVESCLQSYHWTGRASFSPYQVRRDFVFARRADGSHPALDGVSTIAWENPDLPYSQHRAVHAAVRY